MKTPSEIPHAVFSDPPQKPWIKLAGNLRHLKKETARINQLIEAEFGQIDPLEWK